MWPKDTGVCDPPVAYGERDLRWCTMTLGTRASTSLRLMNPSVSPYSWARLQSHRVAAMMRCAKSNTTTPEYPNPKFSPS